MKENVDCVVGPRGRFEMDLVSDGKVVETFVKDNLVVDKAKFNMSRLIGNDAISSRVISKISFGIGATPPAASDTGLQNEIIEIAVSTAEFPSNTSVLFTATLAADQGNAGGTAGIMYYEAGLKCVNGDLFSRVTFSGRPKNEKIAFIVRWRVYWA